MKERRLTIFAVVATAVVGVLFYLNFSTQQPRYSWLENYRANNDQPYGTLFIRKLLEGYRESGKFTINTKRPLRLVLKDITEPDRTDYVFIGQHIFLDEQSREALARFIEAGGNAFIATARPPTGLLESFYQEECGVSLGFEEHRSTSVEMNFYHPEFRTKEGVTFEYRFGENLFPYGWRYVSEDVFCDSTRSLSALGYQENDRVNFVRIPLGKGALFLHTTPLVFTNYAMTDKEKVAYASVVFSHLDGEDMLWDEFSKLPVAGNAGGYYSPLYYLLDQPSLKYAWWLLLITALVYVLFAARRKQRPVPVLEQKSNTSLEFVRIIARLHYKNGNHLAMAHKKMKYFLYFVRSKYGIHAERFGDEHIAALAERSRVDRTLIETIFRRFSLIEERFKHNIEADRLMALCESIDEFYYLTKSKTS